MSTSKTENLQLHQWGKEDEAPQIESELNENFTSLDAAVAKAQKTAEEERVAVGTYTGDGGAISIETGFQPKAVFINGTLSGSGSSVGVSSSAYMAFSAGSVLTECIELTATGFTVKHPGTYPMLTQSGRVYDYIAIR
jgi:hypothetical protein